MKQRKPWITEQKELEEKGYVFNDRGEILHYPFQEILPVSVHLAIRNAIKMEEPKKKPVKKKKGRK